MRKKICYSLSILFLLTCRVYAQDLNVYLLDQQMLQQLKQEMDLQSEMIKHLQREANEQLQVKPHSVLDKKQVPPSGDKHDYMSQGPYWWPDPEQPDGLPYIRRDGEKNPQINQITDHAYLSELVNAVKILSLAYYFLENEKYAQHAAKLIRTWFLVEETAMNPNLQFGQAIPGRTEGRGIGIIETRNFCYLIDAIGLIEKSEAWTNQDQIKMKAWIGDYLDWLLTSEHGKDEAIHGNNHTTWYFVQTMAMALYVEKLETAEALVDRGLKLIIEDQIEPDGKQAKELARTRSWDYSTMNLLAAYNFALLAEHVAVDIWNHSVYGQRLKKALVFLVSFINQVEDWPYQQITPFNPSRLEPVLRIGMIKFRDPQYEVVIKENFGDPDPEEFWALRYPISLPE